MNPNESQEQGSTPVPTPPAASATAPAAGTPATDESNTMVMGILAYLSILVLVPLLVAKDNPTVQFHVRQGMVLFIGGVAVWMLGNFGYMFLGILYPIIGLLNLGLLVLSIIGIIHVVKKEQKELPLVGSLAKHVPF